MRFTSENGYHQDPLRVLRGGHVIFTHGYAGAGPMLECVELLGHHLKGSCVCTRVVDVDCARLLAFAEIGRLEADLVTPLAFRILVDADVEVQAKDVSDRWQEEAEDTPEVVGDYLRRLRRSTARMKLGWLA